jgi:hypothetical protein
LNLVERWFAELTFKRLRRGSFFSVDNLRSAIMDFLKVWNEDPKPTLCLDGHGRIHSSPTFSLPPDPGEDPARIHETAKKKRKNGLST